MVEFAKYSTSWKIVLEPITGIVFISEKDAFMYVVLSKERKHVPYRELLGIAECTTL
jgi:hypothetical protein